MPATQKRVGAAGNPRLLFDQDGALGDQILRPKAGAIPSCPTARSSSDARFTTLTFTHGTSSLDGVMA
jgi:hypothetical protein